MATQKHVLNISNTCLMRRNWESQAGSSKALAEPSWIKSQKNLQADVTKKIHHSKTQICSKVASSPK